jgi:phage I-like protein
VIGFDKKTGLVRAIARAALTNDPAVATLTPLSSKETDSMFAGKVARMLGLAEDASEDEVLAALGKKLETPAEAPLAALSQVGSALGLDGELSLTQIVAAAKGLRAAGGEQGEHYAALQTRVAEMEAAEKKRAATGFVDQAIRDKRAGVKAERDTYIALHMENPGRAEKLVGSLPQLGETATASKRPQPAGTATLSSEQAQVAEMLGIDPEKYAAQLKADGLDQEAL